MAKKQSVATNSSEKVLNEAEVVTTTKKSCARKSSSTTATKKSATKTTKAKTTKAEKIAEFVKGIKG